jgi:hypothetical protein
MMVHLLPNYIELMLQIGVGFFWAITYIFVIYTGFRDRTCGMPFAALCANLTWELLFSFIYPNNPIQCAVTLVWLALDVIILFQFVLYSKDYSPSKNKKYAILLSSLMIAFLINLGITIEIKDFDGIYTGFGINLMMSILFIRMLMTHGLRGQSIYIAYSKWIGTFCASIVSFSLYPQSVLLPIFYVLIFILDVIYIFLLNDRSIKTIP